MTGTWTWRGRLAALLPAVLTASVLLPVLAAAPATARSCSDLTATATSTGGRTQVLLSLPAPITGARLRAGEVTFVQDGLELPVLSLAPVPPTETDLVLVLDSSAAAAPVVDRVRAAGRALLRALSPGTSVAVLTTGGTPAIVHDLARGPRAALPGVRDLTPAGRHALVDAVLAGVRLLPTDPRRQQQLVVVSGGADDGSAASWPAAQQLLVRRGVALDVVDLGPAQSLPGAGAQCPGAVPAAAAAGAARALAAQVEDRRLALLPAVTGASPVQVSVSHGGTVVSTTLATRDDLPAAAPTQRATSARNGSSGAGTLALALLVGLLGLLALVLVLAVRSTRGAAARAAVHELRDARRAGLPPAEADRRRDDARLDLSVALGGGLSARQNAERAAHDEALVRAAAAEHRRAADERAAAFARSAARRERSLLQAEQAAATARAAREATAHLDQLRPPPATDLSGADPVAATALADAERALAAQQLAAQEAMTRRAEAERLADEAEARAEREGVAAAEAQRDREAAERAAAEAAARAAEELRTVGAASEERRVAEEQARAAAAKAADEGRAAESAVARRMVAEAQAAGAEAAQDAAVHRELTALEAAEAAEEARRRAVARLRDEPSAAPADMPATTFDLRAATRSLAAPVTGTASRRIVVPVGPRHRAPEAGGAGAGRPGPVDGPTPVAPVEATAPVEDSAPVEDDRAAGDGGRADLVVVRAAGDLADHAAGLDVLPDDVAQVVLPDDVTLEPPATRSAAPPWPDTGRRPVPLVLLARVVALAVVPAAVALRTLVAGWTGLGTTGAVVVAVAALLTLLGVRWAWLATSPPFALRRRTARRIVAAETLQRAQTDDAARLLAAVRVGGADGAWEVFEERTGLAVPGATRTVVDGGMDPAAFVRYLTARQRDGLVRPQSLVVVAAVPLFGCLLPAALLVLAA